jgi:two-component system OmpR family sensor kinase
MTSIRRQLLIGLLGGMLVCTLIAGAAMYLELREEANELFDYQLKQLAASLPSQFVSPPTQTAAEDAEDDIVIQAWDRSGKLLYASQPEPPLPHYAEPGFKTISVLGDRWRLYSEARHDRIIQIAQPASVRQELAAGLTARSLMPFLISIPVLALLIGVVVERSLQPLRRLAQAVRQRSPDALQPLATAGFPSEVQPMLDSLNDLLRRLDHALHRQRAFVADAAHELRSPLTALQLQLQLAERANTAEQRAAAFMKLHARLDRSTRLVQQLLTLARHEPQAIGQEMQEVDLFKLAQHVVADANAIAESKGIDLGVELIGLPPVIQGQSDSLRVMLNNLVDNALRYTPPGERVDVLALHIGGKPALQVNDSGPGIPEQDRLRVFDRFYRREGGSAPGSGLGLAIVKNVADQHGATIQLGDNARQRGLVVTVVFLKS